MFKSPWRDIADAPKDKPVFVKVKSSFYGTEWCAVAEWNNIDDDKLHYDFLSILGNGRAPVDSCTSHITHYMPLDLPEKQHAAIQIAVEALKETRETFYSHDIIDIALTKIEEALR